MKHFLTLAFLVIASAHTGLSVWGQSNDCYANPCDLPSQSVALSSDFELWYNQEAVNAIVSSVECPPSTDSECPGDLTADGSVSVDDILSILSVFGSVCPQ